MLCLNGSAALKSDRLTHRLTLPTQKPYKQILYCLMKYRHILTCIWKSFGILLANSQLVYFVLTERFIFQMKSFIANLR